MAGLGFYIRSSSSSSSSSSPPLTSLQFSRPPRHFNLFCCQLSVSPVLDKTLTKIKSSGVIACLRSQSVELAMDAARAALDGGISVLEIVISTPGFTAAGAGISRNNNRGRDSLKFQGCQEGHKCCYIFSFYHLGTHEGLRQDARSDSMFRRTARKDILDYVQGSEALYIPGAMTPTEIFSAYSAGAKIVKVYPVSAIGGIRYIAALQKSFSHIPLVASQGITIDHIGEYIAEGASSVVLSDAIFDKEAMLQQNFRAVYQLARLAALNSNEAAERRRRR